MVKTGIKKAEFRFKVEKNQVCNIYSRISEYFLISDN